MTNQSLVSRFIGLSSLLAAALLAFRGRASASADAPRPGESPSWPPPDGVYWGM